LKFDVVVVGAGIVGCCCARECAAEGMKVALVEAGVPGGGASGAAMGHVVVLDDSPAQLALTAWSRGLWAEMAASLPVALEYRTPGTVWVATDDEELAECAAKQARFATADVSTHRLTARELASLEPNLRPGLAGGLLVDQDAVVNPSAAAAFFLAEAQRLRVEPHCSRATSASQGIVRLANGADIDAERIVLAVGTENDLLPQMPIRSRKGHLALTQVRAGFVRHQLVELGYLKSAHAVEGDSVAFNVQPRANGQVLIGSSRQYDADDTEVEPAMMNAMMTRALAFMPALAGLHMERTWAGLRAATADKLPLIGPADGISSDETLWLALGFEGLGITTAPGAARLLVDGMLDRQSAIDRLAYLPARMN
jgi:glycine/D-amino acid oxidase-like deaminating enzyme